MSTKQIARLRTGNPDVDRAVAHVADTVNPVLRTLPAAGTHPQTPTGAAQAGTIYMGTGAPVNANGSNGDFYFRTDTPTVSNQRLYVRAAGAWTGIL